MDSKHNSIFMATRTCLCVFYWGGQGDQGDQGVGVLLGGGLLLFFLTFFCLQAWRTSPSS